MTDWTKPMQQSYEFYTVDPNTWKDVKPLNCVKSCTINRDSEVETFMFSFSEKRKVVTQWEAFC